MNMKQNVKYVTYFGLIVIMAYVISTCAKSGLRWEWIRAVFDKAKKPRWNRKLLWMSVIWSIVATLFISIMIYSVFAPNIDNFQKSMRRITHGGLV